MVLIDSSVWIDYLRRPDELTGRQLYRLLQAGEASVVGIVVAEVLLGARTDADFETLNRGLATAELVDIAASDWVRTGRLGMEMKLAGTPISLTDLAIAAVALERDHELFTLDADFESVPGLRLYDWRSPNA